MSNIGRVDNLLLEHLRVSDVVNRFARLVDDRAWDGLGALVTERVELDYTALFGGEPREVPATAVGGIWAARLGGFDRTQHLVANVVADIDGDTAQVVANVVAVHVLEDLGADGMLTGGGTYRMRLARVDGRWLIAAIKTEVSWLQGNEKLFAEAARRTG